ncbi:MULTISPECIES: chaplin [unclassified Streptomyces]|uniref:chaplin n=2 Tax=Streptomyces TaxID=1883 RepID=UPI000DC36ED2|nr:MULTISPECIES: chaplin [unclassified Streptomyces]RAJ57662.1 LPXTG-motif cell wall-anchored protein [Streptomyces sp. PsTaAH-130]
MKRVTRNGVIALAAASGAIAVAGPVYADSTAAGAAVGSPGLISGNGIQLPVHVPVNVCGDTVNVVGLLNPAMGNSCANTGGGSATRGGSANGGGATAASAEKGSPGAVSGNGIQLPIDLPVNISGDSVNVVGLLNPVFGNHSENTSSTHATRPVTPPRVTPPRHTAPPARPQPHVPPARTAPEPPAAAHRATGTLAHTGADGTLTAAFAGAASLAGGAALYRRFRAGATR